jgi:hypothetical protein
MEQRTGPDAVRPDRRSFLRVARAAGAGVALGAGVPSAAQTRASSGKNVARRAASPMERVRIGTKSGSAGLPLSSTGRCSNRCWG